MPSPVPVSIMMRLPARTQSGRAQQSRLPAYPPDNHLRFKRVVIGATSDGRSPTTFQRRAVGGAFQSQIPKVGTAPNPPALTPPLTVLLPAAQVVNGVLTLKQGTTHPALTVTLQDANGPVNLSAATSMQLSMRQQGTQSSFLHGQGTGDGQGHFTYQWGANDLANAFAVEMEWQVSWGSATARWPSTFNLPGLIVPNLNN